MFREFKKGTSGGLGEVIKKIGIPEKGGQVSPRGDDMVTKNVGIAEYGSGTIRESFSLLRQIKTTSGRNETRGHRLVLRTGPVMRQGLFKTLISRGLTLVGALVGVLCVGLWGGGCVIGLNNP